MVGETEPKGCRHVTEWLAALSKSATRIWRDDGGLQVKVPEGAWIDSGVLEKARAHLESKLEVSSVLRRENACLVPLSDSQGSANVICLHAAHGDVIDYRHVAAAVTPGYAVYALQSVGLLVAGEMPRSVEEMAERYTEELLANQLCDKPYILYGVSTGGYLALDIARRLTATGKPPAVLVLGDTRCERRPTSPAFRDAMAVRHLWLNFICCYMPHELLDMLRPVAEEFWSSFDDDARLVWLFENLKTLPMATCPLHPNPESLKRHLPTYEHYLGAFPSYEVRPYEGRSLYLRVSRSDWEASADMRAKLTGPCRVEEIEGAHIALLRAPAAPRICSFLEQELRRVQHAGGELP